MTLSIQVSGWGKRTAPSKKPRWPPCSVRENITFSFFSGGQTEGGKEKEGRAREREKEREGQRERERRRGNLRNGKYKTTRKWSVWTEKVCVYRGLKEPASTADRSGGAWLVRDSHSPYLHSLDTQSPFYQVITLILTR